MSTSLSELKVLILDCQTTATHPSRGHLLEMGWCLCMAGELEPASVRSSVVKLPPEEVIPKKVQRLTGVSDEALVLAPEPEAVWAEILTDVARASMAVIHYARFELAFLGRLQPEGRGPFPFETLCTHQIAKRLLPDLPSWSLRALAGYFGSSLEETHRASLHVEATRLVWRELVKELARTGIVSLDDLREWLARPVASRPKQRRYLVEREARLKVSERPGIYLMRARDGRVLYVGKATSLRSRVNSYFRGANAKRELLTQVADIHTVEVETPLEAALLETDEIKHWSPPYNVSLRAEARSLAYYSRDFLELSATPDARHPHGPFRSGHEWVSLSSLVEVYDPLRREEIFPGIGSEPDAADAILEEGIRRVIPEYRMDDHRHGEQFRDYRLWLSAGRRWWHRSALVDAEREEESGDEAEDAELVVEWTPELVAAIVLRIVVRAARQVQRARWLTRFTDVSVAWELPVAGERARRYLQVEDGNIIRRGFLGPRERIPLSPGWERPRLERLSGFDIARYDRLRVLLTELNQLVKEEGDVWVRLSPQITLSKRSLRRWLM